MFHTHTATAAAPTAPTVGRSGLEGVVATNTRLSYVDGEHGELLIAGFPVDVLAPTVEYETVLHLLWEGRLPTRTELAALRTELATHRAVPPATLALLRAAATTGTAPMDALRMGVASLSLGDAPNTVPAPRGCVAALVAKIPTLVAAHWRMTTGDEPIPPDANLGHAANYLYMLTGTAAHPARTRALETYLNTVVDHGMNASTFTARVIVSTRSDPVSAVTGAVGALKGPLHGGAPGPALDTVFAIREGAAASGRSLAAEAETRVRETVAAGGRIMGFGHRVYKVRDPRAEVLDAAARALFADAGDRALYDDARTVEAATLHTLATLKPGRRLQTNVEFYTALLLHGIGLDTALFTPTFAVGRAGGWTAHVLEQIAEDRLIRPDAAYVGPRSGGGLEGLRV